MLKQKIKYTDYSGNEREEEFYFNLNKAELAELEMSVEGGLVEKINRLVASQNGREIMAIFKDIVLRAYGQKSPDGRRFIKSQQLSEEFSQTEAYSQLFMQLVTDATFSAEFVKGILPSDTLVKSVNNP